ncbi:hypothetical protein HDV04_004357 [Boothiomyces sp. JEL0838]|nr:hypothetical protein HDV04_004357 [Boothiomyces sp. JEL0838]
MSKNQSRKNSIKKIPPIKEKLPSEEDLSFDEDSSSDISDISLSDSDNNLIRRVPLSDPYLATSSRRISNFEVQREIENALSKSTGNINQATPKSRDSKRRSERRPIIKRNSFSTSIRRTAPQDADFEQKVLMEDVPEVKKKKKTVHERPKPKAEKLPKLANTPKYKMLPPAKPRQPPIASVIVISSNTRKIKICFYGYQLSKKATEKKLKTFPSFMCHKIKGNSEIMQKLSYFADIPQYHDMIRRIKPFQPEKWGVSKVPMKEKLYYCKY